MGLSGLDTALSGLRVAQQQLNVIANNVSNVGTPGYTRKILPQETIVSLGAAVGARSSPIIRNVDLNLERDFWTQVSSVTFYDVQATYLNQIQQFHGAPEQEISIAAEIAELRDKFSTLADSPEDSFLQRTIVDQAGEVVGRINGMADLVTQMRNDAQDEIAVAVGKLNDTLQQIAELNKQIKFNTAVNKTTAALEDSRDEAIKKISEELEVSFFVRSDGVLVVQTVQGVQLADERAETVFFDKTVVGPDSFYPNSVGGIYVGGDPLVNPNSIEVTQSNLGGRLGALVDLRDNILPSSQAMVDELAHKLAMRFDLQGLRLFTDSSGNIPADTAPDPTTIPPTPVPYVGFATEIRVSQRVISDNALVQQGTVATDVTVQSGSNEVIRRVIEFAFGDTEYQEAAGTVDLRASGGPATLQEWLGIYSSNRIIGTNNLASFSSLPAMMASAPDVFTPPLGPIQNEFIITFDDARLGVPLQSYTLNLTAIDVAFPIGGAITDALDQMVAAINGLVPPTDPAFAVSASRSPFGQLIIQSRANITIDASSIPSGMRQDGLDYLGLTEGTVQTTDPWLEVTVGNDPPTRIAIAPDDDETDLVNKLNKTSAADPGVPGLGVDLDAGTGFLTVRPGDDVANPVFGGDIKIVGGPFAADGSGSIPGGVLAGTGVVEALFGAASPVTNIPYASPTSTPGTDVSFRFDELGPGADIDTGIISATTLIDFSQKIVNRQAEEIVSIEARRDDETSFRNLLQKRLLDESGVNIDEELSNLIVIQTAYSAAARVVTAIDEQFRELLRSI